MGWVVRLVASIVVATSMLGAGAGLTFLSAGTLRTAAHMRGLPDVELQPLAQRSEVVAADGSLIANLYEEDRVPIPLDQMPKVLVNAVIATEDQAFFEHRGVSMRGVLRAARENVVGRRVSEGGSTITQQLVKNTLVGNQRTYDRKAREAVLAYRMEQEFSKEEILQRYLNTVYFGSGAYGVVAASERFFGKPLNELTLPEAALLAGLISSPEAYDPFNHPDVARNRRTHVLRRMEAQGYATHDEAAAADGAPLPTAVNVRVAQPTDYFTEEVRRELLDDPRLGATAQERFRRIYRGGIRVETTFDPATQAIADDAVRSTLPQSPFTAALAAIDPRDGAVKAVVGGPGFDKVKYDLAIQGSRQAGSSFKPVALAAWLADGRSPDDVVDATAPCWFGEGTDRWNVDNYEGGSGERAILTLREATVKSSNCAYARMALVLGPDKIAAMAEKLGVKRKLPAVRSIVLGTGEVSPLEMATVYATLAADGVRHKPMFIRRVLDSNRAVIFENNDPGEQVIPPNVARSVTNVLREVVDHGTGVRAKIGRPVAGKTGTAQEWRDAWFDGYTPQLATSVWMGSPTGQESMRGVGGINVTGGSFPAMIWAKFMGAALASTPPADFPPPDTTAWPPPAPIGSMPEGVPLPAGIIVPSLIDPALTAGMTLPPGTVTAPAPAEATTTTTAPPATTTTVKKKHGP